MPSCQERAGQHHEAAKAGRLARRKIKRNRKPDRVRDRYWLLRVPADPTELGAYDAPQSERAMPRGEHERRLALAAAPPEPRREDSEALAPAEDREPRRRGVVIEVSSSLCRVDLEGRTVLCGLRGGLSASDTGLTNVVAVGDEVLVAEGGSGSGVVETVLPRRSVLARPDVFLGHLQHVIAANVDQLLIVASWREPAIWLELVDRYLIAAQRSNLSPIICLNKIDLADDVADCRAALRPYLDLGYRVLLTSAVGGGGISELRQALGGQTTALAGLSGVGKSSLLAAVQPGLQLRVGEVSEHWHLGRHITSQVRLWPLEGGGFVVDTPGIREFGLCGLRRGELAAFFPEIAAAAAACRFADCSHTGEAGCAVIAAVRQGSVPLARYHSYCSIYRSLPGW